MRFEVGGWTIGLLLVWIGIVMATEIEKNIDGLALMVSGGILLLGAVIARADRLDDGGFPFLVGGLVVGLVGLDRYLESQRRELPVAAIIVIAIGVLMIANAFRNPSRKRVHLGHHHGRGEPEEPA